MVDKFCSYLAARKQSHVGGVLNIAARNAQWTMNVNSCRGGRERSVA